MTASLASTPTKYMLEYFQKYLSFGFDMVSRRLTMKYDGKDPEKLPLLREDQLIY